MIETMEHFISEPITPDTAQFDTPAMARGEPGLPVGFNWRGKNYLIVRKLDQWKHSAPEGGRAGGELYLRRHYYKLRMSDDSVWTVYFIRQAPRSGSSRQRWFLYMIS